MVSKLLSSLVKIIDQGDKTGMRAKPEVLEILRDNLTR